MSAGPFLPGDPVNSLVLNVLIQVTLVGLIAVALIRFPARENPVLRYWVSLAALACMAFSPALPSLVVHTGWPRDHLALLLPSSSPASPLALGGSRAEPAAPSNGSPAARSPALGSGPRERVVLWLMLLVWGGGTALHLARFIRDWQAANLLRRQGHPIDDCIPGDVIARVRAALGTDRLPPILTSALTSVPVAVGTFSPAILIPDGLHDQLDEDQLRDVLVHECAHIHLRHPLGGVVQRVAGIVLWPHPLVHRIGRELGRAREEVCDNFVLRDGSAPRYARALLTVLEGASGPHPLSPALGMHYPGWRLEERISGFFNPKRNRTTSISPWKAVVVAVWLFSIGMRVAGMQIIAAERPSRLGAVAAGRDDRINWRQNCPVHRIWAYLCSR